jgi:hypothetical protein
MPTAVISGFVSGDTIDLAGASFSRKGTVELQSGNVLEIVENGNTYDLQLDPSQDFSEVSFALTRDGSGTDIVIGPEKTSEVPTLTVSSSLTVSPGGSVAMGIVASPVDSDDIVSVTIKGVPSYETITAGAGEIVTQKGTTYTITSTTPGAPISDLTLTSSYSGKKPTVVSTLTVTASNTTSGETGTSTSQTVTVTDPPVLSTATQSVALLNQSLAAGFQQDSSVPITSTQLGANSTEETFFTRPHG